MKFTLDPGVQAAGTYLLSNGSILAADTTLTTDQKAMVRALSIGDMSDNISRWIACRGNLTNLDTNYSWCTTAPVGYNTGSGYVTNKSTALTRKDGKSLTNIILQSTTSHSYDYTYFPALNYCYSFDFSITGVNQGEGYCMAPGEHYKWMTQSTIWINWKNVTGTDLPGASRLAYTYWSSLQYSIQDSWIVSAYSSSYSNHSSNYVSYTTRVLPALQFIPQESVTVDITTSDNQPTSGWTIGINNVDYTANSSGRVANVDVPYGTTYNVVGPKKSGYLNGTLSYTASQSVRYINYEYKVAPPVSDAGTYLLSDCSLLPANTTLTTEQKAMVRALSIGDMNDGISRWIACGGNMMSVPYYTWCTSRPVGYDPASGYVTRENTAINRKDGKSLTYIILNSATSHGHDFTYFPALNYCYSFDFSIAGVNQGDGYCMAPKEHKQWMNQSIVYANWSKVTDYYLPGVSDSYDYWSSLQVSSGNTWYVRAANGSYDSHNGSAIGGSNRTLPALQFS